MRNPRTRALRSKADKDPAEWLPSDQAAHCRYVADWLTVKLRWQLAADSRRAAGGLPSPRPGTDAAAQKQTFTLKVLRPGQSTTTLVSAAQVARWQGGRDRGAVHLPTGGRAYAGPARDPYLYWHPSNVHSIALQLPKKQIALNNDPERNPVVGVWSNAYRTSFLLGEGAAAPKQAARQGLAGFSSSVLPTQLRDHYHLSSTPATDAQWKEMRDWVKTGVMQPLFGTPSLPLPPPDKPAIEQIFLYGIAKSTGPIQRDLNAHVLNRDADPAAIVASEQLRLNMTTRSAANRNPAACSTKTRRATRTAAA